MIFKKTPIHRSVILVLVLLLSLVSCSSSIDYLNTSEGIQPTSSWILGDNQNTLDDTSALGDIETSSPVATQQETVEITTTTAGKLTELPKDKEPDIKQATTSPVILDDKPNITTTPVNSSFKVYFLDVSQTDSALILCYGQSMLIDGGNVEDSSLVYSFLKKHEIKHLDYIVGTHAHEDHIGGLAGALNYTTVDTAYCPVTE